MVRAATPREHELEHTFLSPEQVCERLPGVTPHTLAMWRYRGRGPSYRKLGRIVVYPLDELLQWLDAAPGHGGV